uniref:Uncharacterized protein n=1 Tax=Nelumbo nucifera TaxID=4432 RepID=A0A822ZAX0_NELNU|nr:TPA_asm: hypothetical protein HUJ06_014509 [Nelumbo nucifera]
MAGLSTRLDGTVLEDDCCITKNE